MFGNVKLSTSILSLPLIQEEHAIASYWPCPKDLKSVKGP